MDQIYLSRHNTLAAIGQELFMVLYIFGPPFSLSFLSFAAAILFQDTLWSVKQRSKCTINMEDNLSLPFPVYL